MVTANSHISPEEDSREICTLLRKAVHGGMKVFQLFLDPPQKLSLKKLQALMYLEQHLSGAVSIGELAEGTASGLGWASRIADVLACEGLVTAIRDSQDRRVVHLKLTQTGIFIASLLLTAIQGPIATALSEAQPKERAAIGQFLQRFTTALNQNVTNAAHESPLPFVFLSEKKLLNGKPRA